MYNERRIGNSELLQLILLDSLFAQSGSEHIIFQGGTALRWVYGGMRFSEDLDFVTNLSKAAIEKILRGAFQHTERGCIAQFGPGQMEVKRTGKRKEATKLFYVYRPEAERERIAVKLEFETLKAGHQPEFVRFVLRDLPLVGGLITAGRLIMPYSSSVLVAETPQEIFSDKIRALYERKYLKGRDVYDIWWMRTQLNVIPEWARVREKLSMYQASFVPAREADYFQKEGSLLPVADALKRDLTRFLPPKVFSLYEQGDFGNFIAALREVTTDLLAQNMADFFKDHERRKGNA